MQVAKQLLSYKTSPNALRLGVTKGWALGYSIPERIFKAHTRNYLKLYYAIKEYLDTQHVKILSFNLMPTPTTTIISMNIFWYKPVYRQAQSRRSKNLTNERKLLQKETMEDIADYQHYQREKMEAQQAAEPAAQAAPAQQTPKEKPAKESKFKTIKKRQRA